MANMVLLNFYNMKTMINIWNPFTGNKQVELKELRELICDRRKSALIRTTKHKINVNTINLNNQQVATHYKSFQIRQFNLHKAIEVYNQGGCQIATIKTY